MSVHGGEGKGVGMNLQDTKEPCPYLRAKLAHVGIWVEGREGSVAQLGLGTGLLEKKKFFLLPLLSLLSISTQLQVSPDSCWLSAG